MADHDQTPITQARLDKIMQGLGTYLGEIERDIKRDLRAEIGELRAELDNLRDAPKPRFRVKAARGRSEVV